MESSEALARGIAHHQAGRLSDAEQIYRQILATEPDNAQAWNLLGVTSFQRGDYSSALNCIARAIELDASQSTYHRNLGNVYQALQQFEPAVACYRRAIELSPGEADAHHILGLLWQDLGQPEQAIASYRRAIELDPDSAEAHNNLGNILQEQGCPREAADCYRRAVALKPDLAEVHFNLAAALQKNRQPEEAIASYRRALELKPEVAAAHHSLGNLVGSQGCLDEAAACYRRALQLQPNFAEAYSNLGNVLRGLGQSEDAITCYRRALELKPNYADAYNNLGNAFREQGLADQAVACYRRAVELRPDYVAARGAWVHELQHLCQWDNLAELTRQLIDSVDQGATSTDATPMAPFCFLTLPATTTPGQQLRCARQWADANLKLPSARRHNVSADRRSRHKSKLTVGYLSADFQTHATAMLVAELFEKHDRDRFSIIGYSYGADDGTAMRSRLANALERFVDVRGASFLEAANRIATDEVDILVDLKGYTADARPQILTHRPAPIQVNYLGYPGTMGTSLVDYILVDDFVVPADQQPFYSERLVHLPGCYQPNDSQRAIAAATPSRAECGLPAAGFVFGCFNNSYKITPQVFGAWMRLLSAVPDSVLWLFETESAAAANLRREATARGIAADRLIFAPRLPPADHLARHRLADLFLDTLPVNAHTTASDALWAGCPLLTICGVTFIARVAGSLLRAVGLSELVTSNLAEYEALALRLARDPGQLALLRARLEAHRHTSALFDGGQIARSLEQAYATMWEIHAAGEQPRAFRVSPA